MIRLIVFDWAGTTTDFGSQAPVQIFDYTFSQYGIHFSRDEINAPMGMEKKAHIRAMLSTDHGRELWKQTHGCAWNENNVEAIYQRFESNLKRVVGEYSHIIPGVNETVEKLRNMGIVIASTTGYTSEIMEGVLPTARAEGYEPDIVVTPDVTGIGRPSPFMLYECMRRANVWPASDVVKVGDTVVDILEGKNAGAWTVGVLKGSNAVGLSKDEYESMPDERLSEIKKCTERKYIEAGADIVIDSILDLPLVIESINAKDKERA